MPKRSGCGALPSLDNFLNVSLDTGEYLAIFGQRDLPVNGSTAGVACFSFCCIAIPYDELKNSPIRRLLAFIRCLLFTGVHQNLLRSLSASFTMPLLKTVRNSRKQKVIINIK